jgi:transcriptional regulator with XRE-family HTH domain
METHIGNRIRNRLAQVPNLTVKAFAERIGVHEQTVYDIYKRTDINTELLKKISEALEVPIAYFFEEETYEKSQPKLPLAEPKTDQHLFMNNGNTAFTREQTYLPENTQTERLKQELAWERERNQFLERMLKDKEYIISLLELKLREQLR